MLPKLDHFASARGIFTQRFFRLSFNSNHVITMTPAILALQKAKIPFAIHEYQHDPKAASYGLEAAEKIGVDPHWVFKTLVVQLDQKEYLVAVVPVIAKLNLKAMAKAAGGKKVAMGDVAQVERMTGYVVGGVSPLGQKKRLRTFIDISAAALTHMYVSAGKRGMDISLVPTDLVRVLGASFAPLTASDE